MFDELCVVLLAQVYFDGKLVVFTKWRTIFVLNCVHCCSYVSIEFFHHFVPSQLQL